MTVQTILLSHVDVGTGRRSVSRPAVKELAASIAEIGLLSPIAVYPVGDAYELIAGRHRIEAVKSLGWTEIPAILLDLDAVQREMAEIDENLVRCALNAADTARQTARRKELYLRLHPETARGVAGAKAKHGSANADSAFAADTAAKTGRSVRSVQVDAQIGESIPDDVFEAIEGTPLADSKTDLLNLARLSEDEQRDAIADADLNDKASIRSEIEKRKLTYRCPDCRSIYREDEHICQAPRHARAQEFGDTYVEDVNQDTGDEIPVDADPDADAPVTDGEQTEGGWPEPPVGAVEEDGASEQAPDPALTVTPSDWPGTASPSGDVPPVAVAADAGSPTPATQPAAPATRINGRATFSEGIGKSAGNKGGPRSVTVSSFTDRKLDAGELARALLDNGAAVVKDAILENATPAHLNALRVALNALAGQSAPEITEPAPATGPRKPSEIVAEIKALPIGLQRSAISSVLSILADDLPADDQRLFLPRLETLLTTIREGKGAVGIRALAGH